jgi:hypothetical protein
MDMKVPLAGLTENTHLTNNLSIYGARRDLEIAYLRTKLIHDLLSQCRNPNNAASPGTDSNDVAVADEEVV